ncbi:Zn-dependent protease with chaperone function [Hahella chejuensis KCTC 2396]|uniref:Zn-dependent protease with chaperone function n=1 Tax=Hahella chejuensis (strain KCTC 2396) TaxID=349521 RepID=Q2SDG4_HAHCH|nr:M48 family metallopeptidase [Hahella chejuensis]ABC31310.1 Zn-dependent protease with chaperone function [Hahella chejuensis KCTC 2396]
MDFFAKQERARKLSGLLLLHFAAALVGIALAINIAGFVAYHYFVDARMTPGVWLAGPAWWVALAVIAIVAVGAGKRFLQLRHGGRSVAQMVGARQINASSRNPNERCLVNVVEEMSIASGVPIPSIYIMDHEEAVNAFVAGYTLEDMSLVVTAGTLNSLTRDELQGVIGHEFSHILNADTRLNVQIIAVLAGILLIGSTGAFLLRASSRSGGGRSRDARGAIVVLAAGVTLFILGYIGLFFGRLIQAALSRQREYLADASSVQFTRNPEGIAGALFKIRESQTHSYLGHTSSAQEVNHMCFGESLKLNAWFASHPPLDERIRAIDPLFLTKQRARRNQDQIQGAPPAKDSEGESLTAATSGFASGAAAANEKIRSAGIAKQVGRHTQATQHWSQRTLQRLQATFGDALHTPSQAESMIYALLLLESPVRLPIGDAILHSSGSPVKSTPEFESLERKITTLPADHRLPLLEVCLGALKGGAAATRSHVVAVAQQIVALDERTTLSEFAILALLRTQLDEDFVPQRGALTRYEQAGDEIALMISAFARLGVTASGASPEGNPSQFFKQVMSQNFPHLQATFHSRLASDQLTDALNRLSQLSALLKPAVVEAFAQCVSYDGYVSLKEYELLRAATAVMGCPMPPLEPSGEINSE